ncbi:HD family phosphohydrolase [Paenibacillus swuensis]|uniref:HD family phosphohydrolase n=1 Tax=Paenibacillus swuensis TaxID=1178515 RepID=A0A172TG32_9BACL|nr:HD-GYP domain-containing protein [Paenibacillus swuensis]ANE46018.1 HD family phosphohydrolase [Paenibacillus swuensis]
MAVVAVNLLKSGEKLNQNVLTALGGTLLYKGKVLTLRDLEILKAFLIPSVSVSIDGKEERASSRTEITQNTAHQPLNPTLKFNEEYGIMINLLKKSINKANGGVGIPILDIRNQLETIIRYIEHYNILTYVPPKTTVLTEYMYHNAIMVALTSYQLAKWHGLQQKDLMQVALAGLFHDIGNIKLDESILNKPSKLTSDELEEMKKHTVNGYQILRSVAAINDGVKLAALQHHEKIDGSGYPQGLRDEKIHMYARIVAIADIFHAMTSRRAHQEAISPYLVLEQLFSESFGKLDPALVQTFIYKVTQFGNGTLVRLNDNRVGEIVFSDRTHPTRPWVKVDGIIINLITDRQYFIEEVIQS